MNTVADSFVRNVQRDPINGPLAIVGCERSGVIRDALRSVGVNAHSCDLAPSEDDSPFHIQGDILEVLRDRGDMARLVIVHPECTYVASSGLHWNKRIPGRAEKTEAALEFIRKLMEWAIEHKEQDAGAVQFVLENPQGCIGTRLPAHDRHFYRQTVQPWMFGDDASKATVLRLQNLPTLKATQIHYGREVEWPKGSGKIVNRWANQTDSGQNKLAPSATRWMERSRTYPGLARAVADQWGVPLVNAWNQ